MQSKDNISTLSLAAKRFFSGTMLSRCTGLAREVLMAAIFGASAQVAAFWMAFRFANLLRRMLGEGALNAAFVPQFEKLRAQNPLESSQFFKQLSRGMWLLLFVITLLSEGILAIFLVFNESASSKEVVELTMLMLPALAFISLYSLNSSLLNCERSYFIPSVSPVALNILWILGIFIVAKWPSVSAMRGLAIIIVGAFIAQWAMTYPKVSLFLKRNSTSEKIHFSMKRLMVLMRPMLLGIIGVCATQINSALDSIFARIADEQGPAFLWYAIRLQQLPLGLIGVGLTGALLPPISRALQANDYGRYFAFLEHSIKRTFIFMIPMTAFLLATSLSMVNLVYGRGIFHNEDTLITSSCLQAYSWGIVPMTLVLIFASSFYAFNNYALPTMISIISMLLNVGLNAYFVFGLHLGAISIAIATSLCAFFNAAVLIGCLIKEKRLFSDRKSAENCVKLALKLVACSLIAGLGVTSFNHFLMSGDPLPRQFFFQLTFFLSDALCFGMLFLFSAFALNIQEIKSLFKKNQIFSNSP